MHVAHGMGELGELGLSGLGDAWVGVSGSGNAKGTREIEIFFTICIPNMHPLGAFPNNRPRAVLGHVSDVAAFEVAQELEVGIH